MRFLADECVDAPLVAAWRKAGIDVIYVADVAPGSSDADVLAMSVRDGRILITQDSDFGELAVRFRHPTIGILLLKFHPVDRPIMSERSTEILKDPSRQLNGCITVVTPSTLRSHPVIQ